MSRLDKPRVERGRKSVKIIISQLIDEVLKRPLSIENKAKLDLLQTIASRIGWTEMFNRIQFRQVSQPLAQEDQPEKPEFWWQK